MIDERHEELASLYAFDLLEGEERVQFEAALTRDPALQKLVSELKATAGTLAHTAPHRTPPPALKRRVLASIAERRQGDAADTGQVIAFPARKPARFLPWAIAAGFAICASWFGARYVTTSTEIRLGQQREQLAELALKAAQTQLETERILAARVATDFNTFKADATRQLAEARQATTRLEQQLADARQSAGQSTQALAQTQGRIEQLTAQLADARRREQDSEKQFVALNEQLKNQADLAQLKIATLASMLNNSPQALAVAVWDPKKQEGVFTVDQMTPTAADQRYELWVIDSKPISAGIFSVGADGHMRMQFRPVTPVATAAKFAVTLEANDGLTAHDKPGKLVMASH